MNTILIIGNGLHGHFYILFPIIRNQPVVNIVDAYMPLSLCGRLRHHQLADLHRVKTAAVVNDVDGQGAGGRGRKGDLDHRRGGGDSEGIDAETVADGVLNQRL